MKPSVLNVSQNYYVRGGSDRYFFTLTDLLTRHGHRVIPFSSQQPKNEPTPWEEWFAPGVNFDRPGPVDLVRYVYSSAAGKALRALLAAETVDVAHLHIYYGQLTSAILQPLREAGVPIVQTLHDFKLVCPVYSLLSHGEICEACRGKNFWQATLRRCNRGSLARSALSTIESYVSRFFGAMDAIDRFIAVSRFQRDKMIELGAPADRITTIHNFIDTTNIAPQTETGEYLLYFGRIEQLKGIFTLLEAASLAPEVPLLLVGTGEASETVARLIAERDLKHVQLLGFKQGEELVQLVRGSIATLAPSEGYDNCPMSVLESLAHARPVIGSRIGGIPELVDDEVDGFIVPPADAAALADRMRWMGANRRQAAVMGMLGRQKVDLQFGPQRHYEQVLKVYQSLGVTACEPVEAAVELAQSAG